MCFIKNSGNIFYKIITPSVSTNGVKLGKTTRKNSQGMQKRLHIQIRPLQALPKLNVHS